MSLTQDTIDQLIAYFNGDGHLPPRVTNAMLLFAIREERHAREQNHAALSALVAANQNVLNGKEDELEGGLRYRVLRLEKLFSGVRWLLWPLASAFLGAIGGYVFELFTVGG